MIAIGAFNAANSDVKEIVNAIYTFGQASPYHSFLIQWNGDSPEVGILIEGGGPTARQGARPTIRSFVGRVKVSSKYWEHPVGSRYEREELLRIYAQQKQRPYLVEEENSNSYINFFLYRMGCPQKQRTEMANSLGHPLGWGNIAEYKKEFDNNLQLIMADKNYYKIPEATRKYFADITFKGNYGEPWNTDFLDAPDVIYPSFGERPYGEYGDAVVHVTFASEAAKVPYQQNQTPYKGYQEDKDYGRAGGDFGEKWTENARVNRAGCPRPTRFSKLILSPLNTFVPNDP